ncbi:MAG: hypothetical protein RLZZ200_1266, partial [Pseudomonadota bacterium]
QNGLESLIRRLESGASRPAARKGA